MVADFITLATQLLGGGALTGVTVYVLVVLWRLWTRREDRRALESRAAAQSLDEGFVRLVAAAERQDADIINLTRRDKENRERIVKLETSNRELFDENRTFRALLSALVEGLRRKPPDDAETLLDLILSKVPSLGHNIKE